MILSLSCLVGGMKTLTRLVERRQGEDRYINLRRAGREGERAPLGNWMMMIVHINKERADLNRNRVTTSWGKILNSDYYIVDTIMFPDE